MKYKHYNRVKKIQPTKAKFWCGCDMALIGQWGKCPKCGFKDKRKKK